MSIGEIAINFFARLIKTKTIKRRLQSSRFTVGQQKFIQGSHGHGKSLKILEK